MLVQKIVLLFLAFYSSYYFFYPRKLYGNRFFQNSNVENVGLKSRTYPFLSVIFELLGLKNLRVQVFKVYGLLDIKK